MLPQRRLRALLLGLLLASVAGSAAGAPLPELASDAPSITADHLGGSFTACGRISAFTAPLPATLGSLTVEGVSNFGPHTFPIDETAAVDPLLAGLAAAGEWTCLELVGDGAGVLTSLAVSSSTTQCGLMEEVGGGADLGQLAGSTHELTTIVLDGDAASVIAADADLLHLLTGVTDNDSYLIEACLDLDFAAGGTLAAMALDYEQAGGGDHVAPIACGQVDGTALEYRDPASQPYPAAGVVSVDGFELDATLVEAAYQEVLSFHLDAGLDACLLIRVVDTVIVETAVLTITEATVCGELEVIGGLVFVERVVVGQGLTAINFAEPTPSSIASACSSARAQEAAAAGTLEICGDFQGTGPTTVTISGITFNFEAPVMAAAAPDPGGPQAIRITGPNPLLPFGVANPAAVGQGSVPGCSDQLPDAALAPPPGSPQLVLAALVLAALLGVVCFARRAASTR